MAETPNFDDRDGLSPSGESAEPATESYLDPTAIEHLAAAPSDPHGTARGDGDSRSQLPTTSGSADAPQAAPKSRSLAPAAVALAVLAALSLGLLFFACGPGSDDGGTPSASGSDDQLAAVSDGSAEPETETDSTTETGDENLSETDRLGIEEPPPPASVPSDVEGSLACAKVESALLAAEGGDLVSVEAELAAARDRLVQAGPAISEAGESLIPTSIDDEEWQANAFDFLDVCASTGYEPFVVRPEAGADG